MKICVIGPTYPYRGGISHYTTLLYRHLRKRHDCSFISFKKQYPKWLFPGKTDRDVSAEKLKEPGVLYLIDPINPWTWYATSKKIKKIKPDLLIIPWWVAFWAPCFWSVIKLTKFYKKTPILFICHNVIEHETSPWKKALTKIVLKNGNYFIVHSSQDHKNFTQALPEANVKIHSHPVYDMFNTGSLTKKEAKQWLNIENNLILFFGFVRPYKGLEYLLESMPIILAEIDATLVIAGEFWRDENSYYDRIKTLRIERDVRIVNHYIKNEDIKFYFTASDIVALPYLTATGSGVAQMAVGFNKPVLTTDVGCLPEIVRHEKTGYVVKPKDPESIAVNIISFFKNKKEVEFTENIARYRKRFSWDNLVKTLESFIPVNT
jgi:glycosyltransferase involved in cell wall biosynthesis